jgi:uncharacterized protein (DUF2164 family)
MRIRLSPERQQAHIDALKAHFVTDFDEPLSDVRAQGLLDLFVRELGPPVYNQGVRDATAFLQEKLGDIEGEIYERET